MHNERQHLGLPKNLFSFPLFCSYNFPRLYRIDFSVFSFVLSVLQRQISLKPTYIILLVRILPQQRFHDEFTMLQTLHDTMKNRRVQTTLSCVQAYKMTNVIAKCLSETRTFSQYFQICRTSAANNCTSPPETPKISPISAPLTKSPRRNGYGHRKEKRLLLENYKPLISATEV